jgi:transcription factor SPN1
VGGTGSHSRLKKMSSSSQPSSTPKASAGGAEGLSDEYDSGEEVVRTAEDDAFIDSDDDDELMAEYRTEKQDFGDERPDDDEHKKKKQKRRRDEEDDREAPARDDNPLSVALGDMKKKKHEAWTDDKKGELAQEVLMLIDRAAEEDDALFREGNVPYMKLKALPRVQQLVGIKLLQPTLLEYNLLTALNRWIEPKDRNTLPGLTIRTAVYEMLRHLPCMLHHLKRQPASIGKTIMKLLKNENEIDSNKLILNDIVEKWNRLIFNKSSDPRSRVHRRAVHSGPEGGPAPPASKRQSSVSSDSSGQHHGGFEEILSTKAAQATDGFGRVRVPYSSGFQFTVQPVSKVDKKAAKELLRETSGGSKDVLMKRMQAMSGSGKKQEFRAISASLTGKDKA